MGVNDQQIKILASKKGEMQFFNHNYTALCDKGLIKITKNKHNITSQYEVTAMGMYVYQQIIGGF